MDVSGPARDESYPRDRRLLIRRQTASYAQPTLTPVRHRAIAVSDTKRTSLTGKESYERAAQACDKEAGRPVAGQGRGASRPASLHPTQTEAEASAKERLERRPGGGQVIVHRPSGEIGDVDTINRPDPNPPRDTKH